MAGTTCWNCRNRVSGAVCPTCGAQQAMSALPVPYHPQNPPEQPSGGQTSTSVRQGPPIYVPGGQPGVRDYVAQEAINARYAQQSQRRAAGPPLERQRQPSGSPGADWQQPVALLGPPADAQARQTCWRCRATIRGAICDMCGASQEVSERTRAPSLGGYVPQARQPFTTLPPPPEAMPSAVSGAGKARTAVAQGSPALPLHDLLLALLGGVVCGVLGALFWAYLVNASGVDLRFFNFALGFLVGVGVLVGANGERHPAIIILAAVLGLGSYMLALYFQLSLQVSPPLLDGSQSHNFFALSLGDFPAALGEELNGHVILWVYLFLVPFFAAGTIFKWSRPRASREGL
jgi:hypothetical protein